MEISYQLTEKDYIAFNDFVLKNSKSGKQKNFLILIFYQGIIPLFWMYVGVKSNMIFRFLALTIIWLIFINFLRIKQSILQAKHNVKKTYGKNTLIEFKTSLGDSFIRTESINGATELNFNTIESIKIVADYTFIFILEQTGMIIPNSAFKNEEEKNFFHYILADKVKSFNYKK